MKNFFTFLLCLIILNISATSQNLVAWYKFNGNAIDYSGNNLNGTLVGPQPPTPTTDCSGTANEAYSFPGYPGSFVANGIDVPHSALLNPGSYLAIDITFTINQTSGVNPYNSSYCNAFDLINKGTDQDNGWYGIGILSTTPSSCGSTTYGQLGFTIRFSDGTYGGVTSTNALSTGVCYHAVAVYNGSSMSLTLNGVLQQTITVNKTLGLTTKKLTIGYGDNLPVAGYWFNGKIDELKIYNNPNVPGSGNAVLLTSTGNLATTPYINVGSGFDFGTQPFTYETWLKRDTVETTLNNYGKGLFIGDNNGSWGIGIYNNNTLYFTKVGINSVSSTGTIADTNWHYVAVVYTGTQILFYIDGVASGSPSYTDNFNNTSGNYIIGPRQSFGNSNGDQALAGKIDETRIWKNVALTQTQIRGWMCKKVTSAHPAYSNLFAYYRFDEGMGTTTADLVGTHIGTLINAPTWLTSGASIGDTSAYDYTNATKTAKITGSTGESFTATNTAGAPAGIQVYRVDTIPNTTNGANSGNNNRYFGVFQAGGTAPTYTAVYNYSGNPYYNPTYDYLLALYKRHNNSDTVWTNSGATLNTTNKTLTATGQSTEYILGVTMGTLPVTLINFAGYKEDVTVKLSWQSQNEINFSHFEVERSKDGLSFISIGNVEALHGSSTNTYSFKDNAPAPGYNFYRLRQVTADGQFTYSKIIKIDFSKKLVVIISPNPAKNYITINTSEVVKEIRLLGFDGKLIHSWTNISGTTNLDISNVAAGVYIVKIISDNEIQSQKIVKQ